MAHCFTQLDALGTVIGFRIDGHNRKRSLLGAILTVTIIIISFMTLGFLGFKYVNKDEVYQKTLNENWENGQTLILDSSRFHFATNFEHYDLDIFKKTWTLSLYHLSYDLDTSTELFKKPIIPSRCIKENWVGVGKEYDLNKIDDQNCYDIEGIELSGNNHYGVVNKLELALTISEEVMNNSTLQEEIKEATLERPAKVVFYFYNSMFSSNTGNGTITHFIDKYSFEIHLETYKESSLYISEDELKTIEDKILVNEETTISAYNTKTTSERSVVRNITSDVNFILDIDSSTTQNITEYSYMTFSEMVARVGGIINILILFSQLIVYVKNYWDFEYKLTQKYFNKINEDITIHQCPNKSWIESKKKGVLSILERNRIKKRYNSGKYRNNSNSSANSGNNAGNVNNSNNPFFYSQFQSNSHDVGINNSTSNKEGVIDNNLVSINNYNNSNSQDMNSNTSRIKLATNNLISLNNNLKASNVIKEAQNENDNSNNEGINFKHTNLGNNDVNAMNIVNDNNKNKYNNNDSNNGDIYKSDLLAERSEVNLNSKNKGFLIMRENNPNNNNNSENSQIINTNNFSINNINNKDKKKPLSLFNKSNLNVSPLDNNDLNYNSNSDNNNYDIFDPSYNHNMYNHHLDNSNDLKHNRNPNQHSSTSLPKYTKYGTLPNKVKNVNFCDWFILKYFQQAIHELRLFRCRELPLKSAIYNKIQEYLDKALNIGEIEQRYLELEMLKLVIFDEKQLRAFQNISFLKSVEDITKYQHVMRQEDSNEVDPKLEKALQHLFARRNNLDRKLNRYFDN